MAWIPRSTQPDSGASVPVGRRVPARPAYNIEDPSHGQVVKIVPILPPAMAACVYPTLLLTLHRLPQPLPKMGGYRISLNH